MKHAKILISFDVEEFDLPEEYGVSIPMETRMAVSADGMNRVLDVLDACPFVKATFFTTAMFAQSAPELFARMCAGHHEIASHGMNHSSFESADLEKSRKILKTLSGKEITSFRPARLAPVKKEDILAAGYNCESALNPVWLPGRYNNFTASLDPFRETCGLLQIPVSAVPIIRFPLFWLSFKTLPFGMYILGARTAIRSREFFNLYTHPWEYSPMSANPKWKIPGYITKHAGDEMADRLFRLLQFLDYEGKFVTFADFTLQYLA